MPFGLDVTPLLPVYPLQANRPVVEPRALGAPLIGKPLLPEPRVPVLATQAAPGGNRPGQAQSPGTAVLASEKAFQAGAKEPGRPGILGSRLDLLG